MCDDFTNKVENAGLFQPVAQRSLPLLVDAIDDMPLGSDNSSFAIGDYGAADGGSSIELLEALTDTIRAKHGHRQIVILFDDLPTADFNSLFLRIDSRRKSNFNRKEVFYLATAQSFYKSVVPRNTLNLIISFNSMHWLSACPLQMTESLSYFFTDIETKQVFKRQASKDWETILERRAEELKPGGFLLVNILAWADDTLCDSPRNPYELFNRTYIALIANGIVTEDEMKNTNFNLYVRTEEEIQAPFCGENSLAEQGLKLRSIHYNNIELPSSRTVSDQMRAMRAWSEDYIMEGLDNDRTPEEKLNIISTFYAKLEDLLENEKVFSTDIFKYAYILVQKEY